MRAPGETAMLLAAFAGCTDAELHRAAGVGAGPVDNRLAIESSFCTEDPATLDFPVKILFAVDTSQSMNRTDPTGRRLIAVQEVVDAFILDPGVEFAVLQFSGATNVLTQNAAGMDGFTRDRDELYGAIVRLGVAEQPTDYEGAVSNILRVLDRDMRGVDVARLARSKYVIIFLSDGLPNPVNPPTNTRSSIVELVGRISDLARIHRPAEIRFHTALLLGVIGAGFRCVDDGLEGGDPSCERAPTAAECASRGGCTWIGVEEEAESLLVAMASAGGGTFRSFPNGEEINFLRIDFTSIRRVFTVKNVVATNLHAGRSLTFAGEGDRVGRATPDSDGDGLLDAEERGTGSDPLAADTDGDGFGDLLEAHLSASGFDPLDPSDADCTEGLDRVDTDGDGLLDCEERFAGTDRTLVDTDADGVPDAIELRSGTNPAADDVRLDPDFDSARNAEEVRGHTDPARNDAGERSAMAYRYQVEERRLADLAPDDPRRMALEEGRACYDFRVENITLADTMDNGINRVLIHVAQAPFDDPSDFGTFRVACVEQTFFFPDFRDPPFPEVEIPPEAFKLPTELDLGRHCTVGSPASGR